MLPQRECPNFVMHSKSGTCMNLKTLLLLLPVGEPPSVQACAHLPDLVLQLLGICLFVKSAGLPIPMLEDRHHLFHQTFLRRITDYPLSLVTDFSLPSIIPSTDNRRLCHPT